MSKKNGNVIKFILIFMLIGIIITGCSLRENIIKDNNVENEIVEEEYKDEISLNVGGKDNELLIRSEGISDTVVNLYGIQNATSIIFNDMVAIAVELTDEKDLTSDVKEMIMNAVLEKDTMIRQVLISEDEKIFDEIESVIDELLNGKPYDNQIKKINMIVEKIKNE